MAEFVNVGTSIDRSEKIVIFICYETPCTKYFPAVGVMLSLPLGFSVLQGKFGFLTALIADFTKGCQHIYNSYA